MGRTKKSTFILGIVTVFFITVLSTQALACKNKLLYIGVVKTPKLVMAAEVLSVLIFERTGTKVIINKYDNFQKCYEAAKKGEADMILDYTGRCYIDLLGKTPETDADKVYSTVREACEREMEMVWLQPLGFSDFTVVTGNRGDTPSVAAPIIRIETLGRSPMLPRVINKLAGRLDEGLISKLIEECNGKRAALVARRYLKDIGLI